MLQGFVFFFGKVEMKVSKIQVPKVSCALCVLSPLMHQDMRYCPTLVGCMRHIARMVGSLAYDSSSLFRRVLIMHCVSILDTRTQSKSQSRA